MSVWFAMLLRKITVFIFALFPFLSAGKSYKFDAAMFNEGDESIDISLFNDGLQLPGRYYVSVYLNGNIVDKRYIDFRLSKVSDSLSLMPCILPEWLSDYGIDKNKFPALLKPVEGCVDFSLVPQADISFDFNQEQLSIVVPPKTLVPRSENRVPENLWDDGIPALLMDYQVESQQTRYKSTNGVMRYDYIKLHPGINAGAWRLRGATSWQRNLGWQRSLLYAERGIRSIKSKLTLGESYTSIL
ncbi:FimD/PapC N-terminal domain-containing protein [Citrobacter sp. A316]|uniref:FimD/PapC N-terminal domain-containing protein n=1 Tax=Citrobacter sp. A316 TaxID=1639132 RepID=UPI0009ADF05E|nr:FimD/PapC N-terminal domain-containing protein [Citrobacter sp. A316]